MKTFKVVCLGAGPAGLTAAYLLSKKRVSTAVIEADPTYVGGISKTVIYRGFRFDIGGHRFFSKSSTIEALWTELLPHDLLVRPRSSRIFYRGVFFSYPLKAFEALTKLGWIESLLCVLSYIKAKCFPIQNPVHFQDWVSNQFGVRLFRIFFKTYTEKVWGMDCKEISADWAAQRIKGLSLGTAIWNAFSFKKNTQNKNTVKSLIESFRYPRLGPGMMWEAAAARVREKDNSIYMGCRAESFAFDLEKKIWTITYVKSNTHGESVRESLCAAQVISSLPLRDLVLGLNPPPSLALQTAAKSLKYRDFITVMLMVKGQPQFEDQWIYIHDPKVRVGRIQNFKSWSPEMVPNAEDCCYGLEYFCFEADDFWNKTDAELLSIAKQEIEYIGLAHPYHIFDGCVVRQPKAYPVYDAEYTHHLEVIKQGLQKDYPGMHLVGRNGMHKYNNQDHAMMTALLTVENILQEKPIYDVWQVNQDAEYQETVSTENSSSTSGLRQVPRRLD